MNVIELTNEEFLGILEARESLFLEGTLDPFNDIDISAETINQISEYCLNLSDNDIINESAIEYIIEEATRNMDESDKKFKDFLDNNKSKMNDAAIKKLSGNVEEQLGIKNGFIISSSYIIAKDIVKIIKTKGINKESKEEIKKSFNTNLEKFCKSINARFNIDDEVAGKFSKANLKKALVLTFEVILENTILNMVLTLLFGPSIGTILTTVIIAPIVEEFSKSAAVKGDFIVEYMFIFNLFEFSMYMSTPIAYNNAVGKKVYSIGKFAIVRLAAVGMHLTTSIINYISTNTKIMSKLGIKDKDEENKEKPQIIGQTIGMLIHFMWNSLGNILNSKIDQMVMI